MKYLLCIIWIVVVSFSISPTNIEVFNVDFDLNTGELVGNQHNNRELERILKHAEKFDTLWVSVSCHYINEIYIFSSSRCAKGIVSLLNEELSCTIMLEEVELCNVGVAGVYFEAVKSKKYNLFNRRHVKIRSKTSMLN